MIFLRNDKLKAPASPHQVAVFLCLLGAVLRLWDLGNYSITADELSVLDRVRFNSFSELILHGVVPDFHPAGVQVFMFYYCKLFGTGEWAIRFPFFLCGVISLPLIYRVCRYWFGEVSAVFSLGICAVSQLFIIYSRLARPYAPGLLFCLLTVWFLQRLSDEKKDRHLILYTLASSLSMAAAMYTHYLAFLFVALVGVSGFFLVPRKNFVWWISSGLGACILFVPHFNLFLLQTGYGGIGGPDGWLGRPDLLFFVDFFAYFFNHSLLIGFLIVASVIMLQIFNRPTLPKLTYFVLTMVWAILPPVFIYIYSVKVNPILQMSGLIFSMPFLVFGSTGFMTRSFTFFHYVFFIFLFSVIAILTVFDKDFYQRRFFGEYRALTSFDVHADEVFGRKNITHSLNVESAFFGQYSGRHFSHPPRYALYSIPERDSLAVFRKLIEQSPTDYFTYAWSNLVNPYETLDLIREKYPCLVQSHLLYNAEWYLFAKSGKGFASIKPQLTLSVPCDSSRLYSLQNPYGPTFEKKIEEVFISPGQVVSCVIDVSINGQLKGTELVMEIKRGNEVVHWRSSTAHSFGLECGKRGKIYYASRMPPFIKSNDLLRFYLWQHEPAEVKIYQMQVNSFAGNPGLYNFSLKR